jgi:short-subunit dehydrogenase
VARDLHGKVIVITGASSGIGAATALACAKTGMNVVLNARRAEKLDAVAALARQAGAEAVTVVGDVTEPGISGRMLDAAYDRFDRFDAVFANAGYGFDLAAHEVSDEALRKIFDVNFFASTDLLNAAVSRLLAEGRRGHLLMCSSCLGKFTLPGHSAYSATKAAQAHMCTAMRIELEPRGIYVSSVHPITTTTEFQGCRRQVGSGACAALFRATGRAGGERRRQVSAPAAAGGMDELHDASRGRVHDVVATLRRRHPAPGLEARQKKLGTVTDFPTTASADFSHAPRRKIGNCP